MAEINLDANASYGLLTEVRARLATLLSSADLLNPSSIHRGGQRSRALLEEARDAVRQFVGAGRYDRVVFTSGATEANNLALRIPFQGIPLAGASPHLITTALEHPSVLQVARTLLRQGVAVDCIYPRRDRAIHAIDVIDRVTSSTALVSVMTANNETGAIFPVQEIARGVRSRSCPALFHTDAVQAVGRMLLRFTELGFDMLTVSGHKLGALPGVGAIILGERVPPGALLLGGPQENRWRAGTENIAGIVSLGVAARVTAERRDERVAAMRERLTLLREGLCEGIPDCAIVTDPERSLPNTLMVIIPGIRSSDLIVALDGEGILVSSGAACASGKPEPSYVLRAMGYSEEEARGGLRLSIRGDEECTVLGAVVQRIIAAVRTMRRLAA